MVSIAVINKQQVVVQTRLGRVISIFAEPELVKTKLVWEVVENADFNCLAGFKVAREDGSRRIDTAIFVRPWYGVCNWIAANPAISRPVWLNFDLNK